MGRNQNSFIKAIEELRPGLWQEVTIVNASWGRILLSFVASVQLGQCTSVMFRNRYVTNQELLKNYQN